MELSFLKIDYTLWNIFRLTGGLFVVWWLYKFFKAYSSPLNRLRGPRPTSPILGNLKQFHYAPDKAAFEKQLIQKYGHAVRITGLFCRPRLLLADMRGIQHVLNSPMIYSKPGFLSYILGRLLGEGLLVAEGAEHRAQRRIMNPAFSISHLRELTDIFVTKAAELRECWNSEIATAGIKPGGTLKVDVLSWLSRTTLDIIGLAGFNYSFDALKHGEDGDELSASFSKLFKTTMSGNLLRLTKAGIPIFRLITFDWESIELAHAQKTMRTIGLRLIEQKQRDILEEKASGGGTALEKGRERDLLTLMIRANMSTETPPDQRLSVEQILHQIPTFLVAGHETTSNGTSWALYALALNPAIQTKLRAELAAFPHDTPTYEDLAAFTYLDAVVRETLRLHAVVEETARVAEADDIIPLEKPFTDVSGNLQSQIEIRKGDMIFLPIILVNRMEEIWGADADEFNPERWFKDIPGGTNVPGVWGNMLSFLGGAHSCIGFRFAIVEMKALLFHLIRGFEFQFAGPPTDVGKSNLVVTRPSLKSEKKKGNQLPMLIKAVSSA